MNKNNVLSKLFHRYFIVALNGMALGLFCTLIIGLIIKQIAINLSGSLSSFLLVIASIAMALTGPVIGIGVAHALKAPKLVILASGVVGFLGLLRSGQIDVFRTHVPTHGPDKYVVHNYQAMYDKNGKYAGINEYILDFKPIVDWYLKQTGQSLVKNGVPVGHGYAAAPAPAAADATSGASDAGHGGAAPAAPAPAADATSGASA